MDSSKMMPKAAAMGNARPDMMWTGSQNPSQSHSAVSVVTTVYPGVPSFSGSPQAFNTSAPHPNGTNLFVGPGVAPPTPSPYMGQPGTVSKSSSTSSNYGPDPTSYISPDMQHHQGYPQHMAMGDFSPNVPRHAVAVNAAAQATAAAVATATATATAVALDQSQFQNYPQAVQYGNQPYQQPLAYVQPAQHPSDLYSQNSQMMAHQRLSAPSPYMPASGPLRASRPIQGALPQRYAVSGLPVRGMAPPDNFRHQQYPTSGTAPPGVGVSMVNGIPQRVMLQPHPNAPYGLPPNSYQRYPRGDARRNVYQGGAMNSGPAAPGYGQMMPATPLQNNFGPQANGVIPAYQNPRNVFGGPGSSLPNNPTPPLTPAATQAVPAGGPLDYGMRNGMPSTQTDDVESRLTLPIKNGSILAPFRLEHNSPVSQHMFVLDERTHQLLCTNSNFDLQLKCFHAEDKATSNNWPHNANIQICVNGAPVIVKAVEKPLYIKSYCQKNQNTLQVAVQQCCCSHLFCLSVVNRPTVESVIRQLMPTRSLAAEQCMKKIRNIFQSGDAALMRDNAGPDCNPDIEQTSVSLSLKCPITMQRIKLPARCEECKHPQCFDLRAYLEMNKDRTNWQCPICKRPAPLEALEIDQYVLSILTNLSNVEADEVSLDSSAAWKPIIRQGNEATGRAVKEEDGDVPCNSAKRFKSEPAYNPGSWGQPPLSSNPSAAQFRSPVYKRSDSVLSPYYQSNSSPNGTPAFGSPVAAQSMSNFGGLSPIRQHAANYAMGATPLSMPPQFINTSSADGARHDLIGSGSGVQRQSSGATGQQLKNPHASGFPDNVDSAITSYSQTYGANASSSSVTDFPDFTFDASDLLDSGDMAQTGGSLLNDPEELMKYLADPSDYASLDAANEQSHQSTSREQSVDHQGKFKSSSGDPSSSYHTSSQSSELASMDEILSLLYK